MPTAKSFVRKSFFETYYIKTGKCFNNIIIKITLKCKEIRSKDGRFTIKISKEKNCLNDKLFTKNSGGNTEYFFREGHALNKLQAIYNKTRHLKVTFNFDHNNYKNGIIDITDQIGNIDVKVINKKISYGKCEKYFWKKILGTFPKSYELELLAFKNQINKKMEGFNLLLSNISKTFEEKTVHLQGVSKLIQDKQISESKFLTKLNLDMEKITPMIREIEARRAFDFELFNKLSLEISNIQNNFIEKINYFEEKIKFKNSEIEVQKSEIQKPEIQKPENQKNNILRKDKIKEFYEVDNILFYKNTSMENFSKAVTILNELSLEVENFEEDKFEICSVFRPLKKVYCYYYPNEGLELLKKFSNFIFKNEIGDNIYVIYNDEHAEIRCEVETSTFEFIKYFPL